MSNPAHVKTTPAPQPKNQIRPFRNNSSAMPRRIVPGMGFAQFGISSSHPPMVAPRLKMPVVRTKDGTQWRALGLRLLEHQRRVLSAQAVDAADRDLDVGVARLRADVEL